MSTTEITESVAQPKSDVEIKDCVARPKVTLDTLRAFSGKTLAVCKDSGDVVADAETTQSLVKLMANEYPQIRYRALSCP